MLVWVVQTRLAEVVAMETAHDAGQEEKGLGVEEVVE